MSDQSAIEHPLQKTGDRSRVLLESVQDYAIFGLDINGRVASWNAGAAHITGYSAEEIVGQHFSKFYPDEETAADKPQMDLERATTGGRVADEGWRLRKDGSQFWAFAVISAMRDDRGKLIGFANVTRDLSDWKEAEQKLRMSEEQLRMLVDSVDEYAIYRLDPAGRVATWNSGAEKIKQYTGPEIIGKSFVCFYTPEDVAAGKPQHNLEEARRHGHVRDQGLRVRKDGSSFQADVVITALRDESGKICGYSKVTRDITEQLRIREMEAAKVAAEQANKAKDDFLAALSHELRTPLTPALAAASFLVDNAAKLPAEFREDLETIRRNVQLEARLIDDLLDLTRISRGKIQLDLQSVDAHACARDALDIAQTDIAQKELTISAEFTARQHHIWADPVRIRQVFWNLINNAVKFTGPGGQIDIRTSNDVQGRFHFKVSDTGIGIELERQRVLFNAFEQGASSITRQFGGLGLGLAICKNLVDLHHGAIGVESRGRSYGAAFTVTFDSLAENATETAAEGPAFDSSAKPLRILLVEDHGDTRRILSRLLTHFGHAISVADCVESAVKIFKSQKFDAVLSDIGLPDGTGYEVISQAKRNQPVKGIALTGFGMDEDIRRSKEAGFDFHLTKPVDFAELRTVLRQIAA